ncbi:TetR/AcrR family transcriptional regulator, partial [Mariniphaga sediminis]
MKENKKSKKYLEIMKTARELFWKHGFRRVTIQEICEKAGVSKMTFYKHFPNKIDLAKTVFTNEV